jgi:hypothetical protein
MPVTPTDTQNSGSADTAAADHEGTGVASTSKFPVVGIGASAGGLEALEALAKRLASDGMSYVVLQHLAPGHASLLTEILSRDTPLKVVTIRDRGLGIAQNDHERIFGRFERAVSGPHPLARASHGADADPRSNTCPEPLE